MLNFLRLSAVWDVSGQHTTGRLKSFESDLAIIGNFLATTGAREEVGSSLDSESDPAATIGSFLATAVARRGLQCMSSAHSRLNSCGSDLALVEIFLAREGVGSSFDSESDPVTIGGSPATLVAGEGIKLSLNFA
jgi:hypothetical protein